MELLKKHGFKPIFIESDGAHTWLNWRDYLSAFAPQLFQLDDIDGHAKAATGLIGTFSKP